MFGLRVQTRGRPPLDLALPQESYLVSAGASNHRRSGRARWQASGIDDLTVHGGDQIGPRAWRWHDWPLTTALKLGDRVRIELVTPTRVTRNRLGRVRIEELTKPADISRELADLRKRLKSGWYEKQATDMAAWLRSRPPPRRYRRVHGARKATLKR
jgi:hypothetical protein